MEKKYFIVFSILFILVTYINAYAESNIAIIPFKIANPTDEFTIETGKDYAKLLAIAGLLGKEVEIIDHSKINETLKKFSLNSQRIITEENLLAIGKEENADFILIGTLSHARDGFLSESVLYSMQEEKIISRSRVKSSNLLKLASDEAEDIFSSFRDKDKTLAFADRNIECAFLIDLSYKVSTEWESIKKGIIRFTDNISESWTIDTEVNIIPFSDKYPELNKNSSLKSQKAVADKLKNLIPAGSSSIQSFNSALNLSIKNLPWRRNSDKILIVISNSEKIEGKYIDKYGLEAKTKKIALYTITLGLLKGDDILPLRQFTLSASGKHIEAAYHQKFYDENGESVDICYQGGRVFRNIVYDISWKKGLFEQNKSLSSHAIEKPKSFLDEIFFDEKKYDINPYNLKKYYPLLDKINIINSDKPEDNIETIMEDIAGTNENAKTAYIKPIAKVLVSDGKISLWIKIKKENDLDFFQKYEDNAQSFPLGLTVKKNTIEPYGIEFHPDSLITGFQDDFIPSLLKTNIAKIIKNPGYYTSFGLSNPPVWFIDAQVKKIENLEKKYDIREIGR